jgi:transposase InsO family protein
MGSKEKRIVQEISAEGYVGGELLNYSSKREVFLKVKKVEGKRWIICWNKKKAEDDKRVEEVYLNEYSDINDAWDNIQRFVEDIYIKKRLHSALRYMSPIDFEQKVALNIIA